MKKYILFTQAELEDMLNGREIELINFDHGVSLYFMCKEHYFQMLSTNHEQYMQKMEVNK